MQRFILCDINPRKCGELILLTISPPRFLNGYILAMSKRHIDLSIKSITFRRCSSTMTGVPVLTIWWRHCCILPFKTATILTLQQFSTYYLIPIHGEILSKPIVYASSIVRTSHYSAPYHNRYIIWEKLMSAECAEVSNYPHSEMHHKDFGFPKFGQLFRPQLQVHKGHEVSGLVLGYDQNIHKGSICINLLNWLSYYHQRCQRPKSVECLGHDYNVGYTNANLRIMSESPNICVQCPIHGKWPRYLLPRLSFSYSCIILQLGSTKSDLPISGAPACWKNDIDLFSNVKEDSIRDGMSSSSRICGNDSKKLQRSTWLGWLYQQSHPGCQTDGYDAYCSCQSNSWTGTVALTEFCIRSNQ